ncbi:MAG: hypothetical protein IJ571_09020 [Ruminococcus sp.]|nr:hypothetical protein [Ruminococcus sp.]
MKLYDENTGQQFKGVFDSLSEQRHMSNKVKLWVFIFFAPILVSMWISTGAKDRADLFGGKKTVEGFLSANIISLTILILTAICFVIYVSKTWKGKQGTSIATVMIYLFVLISLTVFISLRLGAISNIRSDLRAPRKITLSSYITCTNEKRERFVVFEDGTDNILLQIPEDKYDELTAQQEGKRSDVNLALSLVEEAGYSDIEVKSGEITVIYYKNSVIYESIK